VFEAVNAIERDYQPYLGTLAAPAGASPEAAAVTAAHGVLIHYFPANAAQLDAARAASLDAILDGPAKEDGVALGAAAAAALIDLRSSDGSSPPRFHVPASADPGVWQLTPGCPAAGGILLHWQDVRPFGVDASDQFRSPPPPALTSARYAVDFNEVKAVGGQNSTKRPQHRADVAQFYNLVLAVGVWNPTDRGSAGIVALRECTHVRAAQHGDQRCSRDGDGDEVSPAVVATGDCDSRRRQRRQPPDERRS
jgi:hypothetical protein